MDRHDHSCETHDIPPTSERAARQATCRQQTLCRRIPHKCRVLRRSFEAFPVGLNQDIADGVDITDGQGAVLISRYMIVAAIATILTLALA